MFTKERKEGGRLKQNTQGQIYESIERGEKGIHSSKATKNKKLGSFSCVRAFFNINSKRGILAEYTLSLFRLSNEWDWGGGKYGLGLKKGITNINFRSSSLNRFIWQLEKLI